jgi:hypothetical protein
VRTETDLYYVLTSISEPRFCTVLLIDTYLKTHARYIPAHKVYKHVYEYIHTYALNPQIYTGKICFNIYCQSLPVPVVYANIISFL